MAVREEEYPASLAVEGREVVHNHPRILGDATAKHAHPGSSQLGGVIFHFNFSLTPIIRNKIFLPVICTCTTQHDGKVCTDSE